MQKTGSSVTISRDNLVAMFFGSALLFCAAGAIYNLSPAMARAVDNFVHIVNTHSDAVCQWAPTAGIQ